MSLINAEGWDNGINGDLTSTASSPDTLARLREHCAGRVLPDPYDQIVMPFLPLA